MHSTDEVIRREAKMKKKLPSSVEREGTVVVADSLGMCSLWHRVHPLSLCNPSLCLFLLCGRYCQVERHSVEEVLRREAI
jgi:hypothetical protein